MRHRLSGAAQDAVQVLCAIVRPAKEAVGLASLFLWVTLAFQPSSTRLLTVILLRLGRVTIRNRRPHHRAWFLAIPMSRMARVV